ncbi:MAG: FAD-binding protein [Anaerolineae bacterium]|nr:FAD-binding protein [Anaerolineae bacterium]
MSLQPQTIADVQDIVRAGGHLLPRGGGSKPGLSTPTRGTTSIELRNLAGILEYEPGEYTFTAYAGTPVAEVATELARNGQYMPFDPLLAGHGATLGGTVAANTAGSGRYRYGGVRDFILGVRFVDGQGQLVRSGGKVVKNAAGFDLSKFMVGSLGRYGIMVEMSFKVFPRPAVYHTLMLRYGSLADALQATFRLSAAPFEPDAVDLEPQPDKSCQFLLRVGGLESTLPDRIDRLRTFFNDQSAAIDQAHILKGDEETALWIGINEFEWTPSQTDAVVKVPLSPRQVVDLDRAVPDSIRRYTCAGHVAWLAVSKVELLADTLTRLNLTGLRLTGEPGDVILGSRLGLSMAQRVKQALDPAAVFGEA